MEEPAAMPKVSSEIRPAAERGGFGGGMDGGGDFINGFEQKKPAAEVIRGGLRSGES